MAHISRPEPDFVADYNENDFKGEEEKKEVPGKKKTVKVDQNENKKKETVKVNQTENKKEEVDESSAVARKKPRKESKRLTWPREKLKNPTNQRQSVGFAPCQPLTTF